jgi:DNA-directed RNA polymerase subunit beta'
MVDEGDEVKGRNVISKLPRATTKTKDITGGLPGWLNFLKSVNQRKRTVLSEIDGYVSMEKGTKKGKQKVIMSPLSMWVIKRNI